MVRTLLLTLLSFVVHLNAFADVQLQQCRQLYSQHNYQASFDTCLPLAAKGSGEASFILSNLYTRGVGENQPDLKNALVWLLESAKQGHAPACFNLAALYERGKVVDQDSAMAYSWYEKGAQRGHPGSQFKVGMMSLKGVGTEVDAKKAQAWLVKAAKSGNQNAQVTLAILLSGSDAPKSLDWYNKAADQGNPFAYSQLAEAYAEGKLGQSIDLNEALYLAQKSVILGRAASQELVENIREKLKNSTNQDSPIIENPVDIALEQIALEKIAFDDKAPADLASTQKMVSEGANPEAAGSESTGPEMISSEISVAETIQTVETVTTKIPAPEIDTTDISTEEVSLPASNSAETVNEAGTDSVIKIVTTTAEIDSATDTRSEVEHSEEVSAAVVSSGTVATEVTLAEVSNESQALAVLEEPSQLSAKLPVEQSVVRNAEVVTGAASKPKDKAWLMEQPSGDYVLQLAQLSNKAAVMRYMQQMGLEGKANYYHAHTNAGRVYVVLYSESFPGLQAAKKAVRETFPAELQKNVWYRRYLALQTSYRAP